MTWNYRVIEFVNNLGADEDHEFAVCEVHYDDQQQPTHYGDAAVAGENVESLRWTLDKMREALEKPVLPTSMFESEGEEVRL